MGNLVIFLIVTSFLIERFSERILFFLPLKRREGIKFIISSLLGILISFGFHIGILQTLLLYTEKWISYVDYLLTGVVIGEGTSTISRLLELLQYKVKEKRIKMKEMS